MGSDAESRTFLGHPRGLVILFFAEMWERFSFYGMRALLIFYLTKHWLFSDAQAQVIYGAYGALVYIMPVLGGYLADRYLGQRKAVQFGAVLLAIGHLLMAVEGDGGQYDPAINVFWLALAFIIVGSGFLKANISVIVGQLYARTDVRRDAAYTIFYVSINLGAMLGTLAVGYLGETYGWQYGFGVAGAGMILGLLVFTAFRSWLDGRGESRDPAWLAVRVAGIKREWLLYLIGIAAIGAMWVMLRYQELVGGLMLVSGAGLLLWLVSQALRMERDVRDRIFAVIFLLLLQPLFWGLFEQAGGSLNLFTDRHVDRAGVPASLFQSINPIFIITLGPLFAIMWPLLGRRGLEPPTPAKFGIALMLVGLGFLVLVWGAGAAGIGNATPVIFIFLIYLLHTSGELCLSPVGLSAMNRLAPAHMASLVMGAWFFATAGGNFVAGKIGEAAGGAEGAATKEMFLSVYQQIGWVSVGIGVVVLLLSPFVTRLMHLDTLTDDPDLPGRSEIGEPQAAGVDVRRDDARRG